jgi:N-formylglutamate amidohydrolase
MGVADGRGLRRRRQRARRSPSARASPFSAVLNGRFKGGYITRTYGDPASGVHAIQMELAKSTHLGAGQPGGRRTRGDRLRPVLQGRRSRRRWSPPPESMSGV